MRYLRTNTKLCYGSCLEQSRDTFNPSNSLKLPALMLSDCTYAHKVSRVEATVCLALIA